MELELELLPLSVQEAQTLGDSEHDDRGFIARHPRLRAPLMVLALAAALVSGPLAVSTLVSTPEPAVEDLVVPGAGAGTPLVPDTANRREDRIAVPETANQREGRLPTPAPAAEQGPPASCGSVARAVYQYCPARPSGSVRRSARNR